MKNGAPYDGYRLLRKLTMKRRWQSTAAAEEGVPPQQKSSHIRSALSKEDVIARSVLAR